MTTALLPSPYDIVLADPPWHYYGSPDKMAAAGKHYSLMSDEAIGALPIPEWLSPKGILFCWTTSAKLATTIDLFRQWGLHYRGVAFVWVKCSKSGVPFEATGVRPSITKPLTEFVLAASRVAKGRPLPLSDEAVPQTLFAPRREHSRKPPGVHEALERMYPGASKVELFSREFRPGWNCWGNETGKFNAAYPEESSC